MPLLTLMGGVLGGLSGFLLQCWVHMQAYPLNVGGRPEFSWPSFIIVTFEMTVLFAGITAVVGMLAEGFSTKRGRRAALIHHDAVNRQDDRAGG